MSARSNTSLGISLIELIEPSVGFKAIFEALFFTNYFARIFIVYICVGQNLLFRLIWVGIQCCSIKGPVFLVNLGFNSISIYKLLGMTITAVLQETLTNTYL